MKKSILSALVLVTLVSYCKAQDSFKDGDNLFSLGIGLGTPFFSSLKKSLPVNPTVSWEKGISDEISVGGTLSYSKAKFLDLDYNAIYIGSRGSYHFTPDQKKTDLYAGATAGYILLSVSDKSGGGIYAAASGFGYSVFGGARYYFSNKIALYGELGYGSLSILNAGVTFKM